MTLPRYFQVLNSSGVPLTTATPTFVDYRNAATGASLTAPANPTHVGSGLYVFTPSDADEIVGVVALIDAGASAWPRRQPFAIHLSTNENQFWAFHVETTAGVLWSGAAPTIGAYRLSSGAGTTSPSLVAISGAYLYTVKPTVGDYTAGVGIWVSYPAGASTLGYAGYTAPLSAGGGYVPPAPYVNTSVPVTSDSNNPFSRSDISWGIKSGYPVLSGHDLVMLSQTEALSQRLWLRLTRVLGEHFLALDTGLPWLEFANKPANLNRAREQIVAQAKDVVGVLSVDKCDLLLNTNRELKVDLRVTGSAGTISLSI